MTVELDEELIMLARRTSRPDGLTLGERVALNLFWRRNVRVAVLARVFQCSKNTIYYNCLTGEAASYPSSKKAREINELVEKMGEDKAWSKYVTEGMIKAVNAANKEYVERFHAA